MLCRNCGYDNPHGYRHCGMCGTPFPHRLPAGTEAQSPLRCTISPLEIASSALIPQAFGLVSAPAPGSREPALAVTVEQATIAAEKSLTKSYDATVSGEIVQQGVNAAGQPFVRPFHPQPQKPDGEDLELKEFITNFLYEPPDETEGEFTMRGQVLVIDNEAPAEFYHPPPSPEASNHSWVDPDVQPAESTPHSRFVDLSESPHPSASERRTTSASCPGLDNPEAALLDEVAPPARRHVLFWPMFVILAAFFGLLGFLEGRAQIKHPFHGLVAIVQEKFIIAPAWLLRSMAHAPAPAPIVELEKRVQPQEQPNRPKDLEAPSPRPAPKPQPGQQELAKAVEASDSATAAAWLWKATARGNSEAPVRLADMYLKGNGVPSNCEQALVLLRSAAVKPNASARKRLAALYANGTCVSQDRISAYEFLLSALEADPTSEWAQQNRQELWNEMTSEERTEVQKFSGMPVPPNN